MNTSSPSLTPAQTTARTAALTAAAVIYVEAKIRIETERALAAARLAAS